MEAGGGVVVVAGGGCEVGDEEGGRGQTVNAHFYLKG